jgi:hypothetical protein
LNWFLAAVFCVPLVELALRLPFGPALTGLSKAGTRAVRVVRAKSVSDHWKEKAMAAYAQATFLSSLKLAFLLFVLFGVAAMLVVALDSIGSGFQGFILGWQGIALSIVVAGLYLKARKAIFHGGV